MNKSLREYPKISGDFAEYRSVERLFGVSSQFYPKFDSQSRFGTILEKFVITSAKSSRFEYRIAAKRVKKGEFELPFSQKAM